MPVPRWVLATPLLLGCSALLPGAPDEATVLEGPLEGLTSQQFAVHAEGDAQFDRVFGAREGAGPIFIAQACSSCHPGNGKGNPTFDLKRFGRTVNGVFDPMRSAGGPQLQNRSVDRYIAEVVPAGVTGVATFNAPSVTGLGFLDAVDDTTLLALADPDDANGDGISGRVQLLAENDLIVAVASFEALTSDEPPSRGQPIDGRYIGRFGKKGVTVNLLHQVATAYHEDMGLTSDVIVEDIFNPQVGVFTTDNVPDPEVPSSVISAVTFYMRTIRAPPRRGRDAPDVVSGEAAFRRIGCASCHLPSLRTGSSSISPLNQVEFHPYSDMLLHDMGPDLDDGYTEGIALTSEWRTAPLWGVGLAAASQGGQMHLLHDGRAPSFRDAIRFHGGEGAASRAAFDALTVEEQEQVLRFLESL